MLDHSPMRENIVQNLPPTVATELSRLNPSGRALVAQLLNQVPSDFSVSYGPQFSSHDFAVIRDIALKKMIERLHPRPEASADEIKHEWQKLIRAFHKENHWGVNATPQEKDVPPKSHLGSFLRTSLISILIMKSILFYFGLQYSNYPGEGYGWYFLATLIASFSSLGYFLWKYRNFTELE